MNDTGAANPQSAIRNPQSHTTHHSPLTTHHSPNCHSPLTAHPSPVHRSPLNHPRTLVTVATYNERENLPELADAIGRVDPTLELLVIDDNSPDGTGQVADQMAAAAAGIHVLHRSGKLGLGTAV